MSNQVRDMTSGSPVRLILTFALPLMIGNVFQQFYTMVDAAVVGNALGVSALAALGAADWCCWVVLGIVTGFAQGFSIPMAQSFGAGDYQSLRKAVTMTMLLSGIMVVVLTVGSLALARPAMLLLNTPREILDDALLYLIVMFSGIIARTFYNVQASILRALGNGRTPLIAMIIASVTNIALDILFVYGFGWGIGGAAFATVLSEALSGIVCFVAIRRIDILHLEKEDWAVSRDMIRQLLRLGAPTAFQNAVIGVGGMVVQNVVNTFGMVFIAGFTATNKLYGLLELAATSFGYSMVTYTGQNLGAGHYGRIRSGMRYGILLGIGTAVVISIAMLAFGRSIVGVFISDSPEVKQEAVRVAYAYLRVMSYYLFILYMLHIYRSALYGLGDTIIPMISGIIELAMRILAVMLLPPYWGETGIYYAEVLAWIGATIILAAAYYYHMHKFGKNSADA